MNLIFAAAAGFHFAFFFVFLGEGNKRMVVFSVFWCALMTLWAISS